MAASPRYEATGSGRVLASRSTAASPSATPLCPSEKSRLSGVEITEAIRKQRAHSTSQPAGSLCQPWRAASPTAKPIAIETAEYGAAMGSMEFELMRLVTRPTPAATQGPASSPHRTVPIESRKNGSFSSVASTWPVKLRPMAAGIRMIPGDSSRSTQAPARAVGAREARMRSAGPLSSSTRAAAAARGRTTSSS